MFPFGAASRRTQNLNREWDLDLDTIGVVFEIVGFDANLVQNLNKNKHVSCYLLACLVFLVVCKLNLEIIVETCGLSRACHNKLQDPMS